MKKRVLVPTMGALHQGHGALINKASTLGDPIVSIFVNPTQFGPTEDFEKYPRSAERDLDYALKCGAKEVLFPKVSEIYPSGPVATEDSGFLGSILEGAHRPGFFNGVVTVVKKLFETIVSDIAIFGEKDWQQLILVKDLSKRINGPSIVSVSTVRDENGLALSSRNAYLSDEDYEKALYVSKALEKVESFWKDGLRDKKQLETVGIDFLSKKVSKIDYLEVRPKKLLPELKVLNQESRVLTAVWIKETRLIDNKGLSL